MYGGDLWRAFSSKDFIVRQDMSSLPSGYGPRIAKFAEKTQEPTSKVRKRATQKVPERRIRCKSSGFCFVGGRERRIRHARGFAACREGKCAMGMTSRLPAKPSATFFACSAAAANVRDTVFEVSRRAAKPSPTEIEPSRRARRRHRLKSSRRGAPDHESHDERWLWCGRGRRKFQVWAMSEGGSSSRMSVLRGPDDALTHSARSL